MRLPVYMHNGMLFSLKKKNISRYKVNEPGIMLNRYIDRENQIVNDFIYRILKKKTVELLDIQNLVDDYYEENR